MKFGWVIAALALLPATAMAKKGLYFGFDLGYATVSGQTAIKMKNTEPFPMGGTPEGDHLDPDRIAGADLSKLFSTQEGEGFAAEFIFGYNILGFVAIEAQFSASGNSLTTSHKEGQGGVFGIVRLFPAQLFEEVADRWWDPYVYVGGGGQFIGYYPQVHAGAMQNDGRSWWPGGAVKYGFGCDFYVVPFVSLGLDFGFTNMFMSKFHIDDSPDITTTPVSDSDGTAFAFTSTAKLTFHFLTE